MGRVQVHITGAVQGLGFRPFVYRLASELRLGGYVRNSPEGVTVEAEGPDEVVRAFLERLREEKPAAAEIRSLRSAPRPDQGETGFSILPSTLEGERAARVPPDRAPCQACLEELFDPSCRRYLYPFLNCTDCGPRYSILEELPYDRSRTTMKGFPMCRDCLREYGDPADRRFHAEPNACPACGPTLELWDREGKVLARSGMALEAAVEALLAGRIVALKGVGGFHLLADAAREETVTALRERKRRPHKPLAVMFPSLDSLRASCRLEPAEAELLESWRSPIVLVRKRRDDGAMRLAESLAPGNACLGALLPCSPLHVLLARAAGRPLVATSGNLSEEPIAIGEADALQRLGAVADLFLVHDRPIARALDDSVVQVAEGAPMVLRLARGYAPQAFDRHRRLPSLAAAGGQVKGALALTAGNCVILGQHLGDLDHPLSREAYREAQRSLHSLYGTSPEWRVGDRHPDYASSELAGPGGHPLPPVQHHHAHIAAALAEWEVPGPVLGVAWDGVGMGMDGTLWGGEFLRATPAGFERLAHLRPFRLPGGDASAREPARSALAVLHALWGEGFGPREDLAPLRHLTEAQLRLLAGMLGKAVNAPFTTSAGRLFDAAASLAGVRQTCTFEGQAALEWESLADPEESGAYPMALERPECGPWVLDWRPLFEAFIADLAAGLDLPRLSARFHNSLAEGIAAVARASGLDRVVLSGGCFQNRLLLGGASRRLRDGGFEVFWPRRAPPNDGGLALGQAVVAAARLLEEEDGCV